MPVIAFISRDGFDRPIDRCLLIVARRPIQPVGKVVLSHDWRDVITDAFKGPVLLPQLIGRRKTCKRNFGLDGARCRCPIMKEKSVAIAAEDEWDIECSSVR